MKFDLKIADPAMKINEITFSPTGGVNKTADLLADCLNGEKIYIDLAGKRFRSNTTYSPVPSV